MSHHDCWTGTAVQQDLGVLNFFFLQWVSIKHFIIDNKKLFYMFPDLKGLKSLQVRNIRF